jgi:hypothetical protein
MDATLRALAAAESLRLPPKNRELLAEALINCGNLLLEHPDARSQREIIERLPKEMRRLIEMRDFQSNNQTLLAPLEPAIPPTPPVR